MLPFLFAPMTAARLLPRASERVPATYSRRVVFITSLGQFVAAAADLLRALTDERSFLAVAVAATVSLITWTHVGLVLAWRIKPQTA